MSRTNGNALAGTRILIVEDNLLIAMEVEQALESHGAKVTTCLGVTEASTVLGRTSFDFVLSDYAFDGEPVLPLLDLAAARNVPLAVLTGYSSEHLNRVPASVKIFEKPFREEDIIAHIVAACTGRGDGADDRDEWNPINDRA